MTDVPPRRYPRACSTATASLAVTSSASVLALINLVVLPLGAGCARATPHFIRLRNILAAACVRPRLQNAFNANQIDGAGGGFMAQQDTIQVDNSTPDGKACECPRTCSSHRARRGVLHAPYTGAFVNPLPSRRLRATRTGSRSSRSP